MLKDFKYALRQLQKSPGFAITAVLTLALGIGANTAIFTLIHSVVLRPLPFAQSERLMRIEYATDAVSPFPKGWIRALQQNSQSFTAVSGFGGNVESNVAETGTPERVFGAEVMANAMTTLGLQPSAGSFFTAEDEHGGRDPVVVLSFSYWKQRFGQDLNVIGRSIRIDGVSRRVIGVMPAGVRFPYADTQFVTPVVFKGGDATDPWQTFNLHAFGRLKDGVTPSQAQAELRQLHGSLLPLFPWRMPDVWASQMAVIPLLESEVSGARPRLLLLFGAVGLILLIACANVANLMLARAAGREREMGIRCALGASTARLVRQLLAESVVVGLLAGAAGLTAAAFGLKALIKLLPTDTPRLAEVSITWPVLLFAVVASIVAGMLFGFVPALKMSSPNVQDALRSGGRAMAGSRSSFRTSMGLVVGQISLAVVVITAAGLMLHSLYRLSKVDPGFQTERVLTAEVALDANACRESGRCQAFFTRALDEIRGTAGTESVAFTDSLPLSGRTNNYVFDAEGHPRDARQGALLATGRVVTPQYFSALGVRLMRGRLLDEQDASGASRAVVINQRMAERLWPNQDAVGKQLMNVLDEPQPAMWNPKAASTVVGIVSNTRGDGLANDFGEEVYLPMTAAREQPVMSVVLRTKQDTAAAVAGLRGAVSGIDQQIPVTRVQTLDEKMAVSLAGPRSLTVLLLAFGTLALVIGSVGVYGLIAYIVSWRTREIGIRMALGAQPRQIMSAVLKQSMGLAAAGSIAGLIASALLAQVLRRFLFGVGAIDPVTFFAVPTVMVMVSILAASVPAMRAARVDPMESLRSE